MEISEDGREDRRAADSVLRALDLVERDYARGLGLADMAAAACYSPFYFSRLFARATGHSPYEYLMRRRAAIAAERVVDGSSSLIDIALGAGFDTPDGLARAFKRCFGSSPSEARKSSGYPRALARTPLSREFVEESLARPFPPPSQETLSGFVLDSAVSDIGGDGRRGTRIDIAQRDSLLGAVRPFSGSRSPGPDAPPAPYPGSSAAVPGGRLAVFQVGEFPGRLEFTLEFAYRCWLPSSGRTSLPDFDMAEYSRNVPLRLSLYLGP
jgi:AraC-like DNA-binding protein